MKKLITMIAVLACVMIAKAQNYEVLHIEELINDSVYDYCADEFDGIIIHKAQNCPAVSWSVSIDGEHFDYWTDSIILQNTHTHYWYFVGYSGCSVGKGCAFLFHYSTDNVNPFAEPFLWKRTGESTTLVFEPMNWNMEVQWSTGETENEITVTEPGTYSVTIIDACGSETYTIQVRDNAEITLATCDLETNHNMVTWPTTSAQAEYVGTVEIKRDGMVVGTVNYSEGQFIDNIGSDAASRTYTITAIGTDGNPCPISSYPKETIHMSYTLGMNNTIEIGWNTPTGYDLLGYNVCEWHENDGSLSVIDYVGASVTSYTCSQSQFDEGYIVVQGVEAGKDGETRLLSNRSLDLVGIGENEATAFRVYPNPAKDRFTIEGTGTLTVTNTLGQTVLIQEIDGKTTIELPQGLYFVKLGEATRKVVVE